MSLLVGEIQAVITADGSAYAKELDKAAAAGKKLRADSAKPVEINGDGKPALNEIGKVDSAVGSLAKSGKPVTLTADDKATPIVRQVDGEKLSGKTTDITADDHASGTIDRVKGERIPGKQVPVEVDDQTAEGTRKIGGELTGWAAGLGLGAIIGKGIAIGIEKGDARVALQNQMGLTNQDAKRYGAEAGNVWAQGFAESREQVNAAFSSASSNFRDFASLSGDMQQKISGDGIKIANTFGEEVSPVMAAAGSLVANKVAPDIESAMDTLTAGLQGAANKGEDVLDTFTEYSPFFHRMGLSSAEALGFMNEAILNGARSSDIAADAIKEFSLRAIDGSTQTADGFTKLGLNAEDMAGKIAAGGDTAHDAFLLTLKSLQDLDDPLQRNIIGVELFGTQWEDALRDALPGMDLAKIKMQGIEGSTDRLKQSTSGWLDGLMRGLGGALPAISQATLALAALPAVAGMAATGFGYAKDKLGGFASRVGGSIPILGGFGSGARTAAAGAEGAAASGGRMAGMLSKVGAGLSVVSGAAIPVAIGFGLVSMAWMSAAQHEQDLIDKGDDLGTKLAQGGAAATKAAAEINQLNGEIAAAKKSLDDLAANPMSKPYTSAQGRMGQEMSTSRDMGDKQKVVDEAIKKYNDLKDKLGEVGFAQAQYNAAVIQSGPNSAAAAAAQQHLADVTSQQADAQKDAALAARTNTQALYDQQQQVLSSLSGVYSYEQGLLALDQAHTGVTEAEKNLEKVEKNRHSTKQQLADATNNLKGAQLAENQSVLQSINAFVAQRVAESGATTEQEKAKVALYATNEAAVKLAQRYRGTLPDALRKTIGAMDATQLAAAGCTTTTDKLGNTIVRLPNGKKIKLTAEDRATPTIGGVQHSLDRLKDKRVTVHVTADTSGFRHSVNSLGTRFGLAFYASGTDYHPGGLAVVGEEGPELVNLPRGSQVIPSDRTKDMMQAGRASHHPVSSTSSSSVDRSRHITYVINETQPRDITRAVERREARMEVLYAG